MKKLMAILLSLTLACAAVLPALAEGKKDETVYVLANPDGSARRVIVSDYLSNPDGADTIADVSNLEKIQNVKGDEAFADGVWQAKGNEIYYQGDSSEALPVELKISATLDGTEIAPADLAGKSGHVTLRFDYAVSASYTKDAETVAVPFAVITGALLDNEVFANVSIKNGQAVNDGDRTVAVGLCVPGLTAGLKLENDKVELPEYLEISADVKNFSLPVTVTLATNEAFAALDADKLQDADAAFVIAATMLQVVRVLVINSLTEVERAGAGNAKEDALHNFQDRVFSGFDDGGPAESGCLFASKSHILSSRGVPYDATRYEAENLKIFKGANHRFATLGHDPVLGLVFGTSNIMTNSITCVKDANVFGIGARIPATYSVSYDAFGKNPLIGAPAGTVEMLVTAGRRVVSEPDAAAAALIKQLIHIGTDLYTPCGIQVPFANLVLDKAHTEALTKYVSTGDVLKVGMQAGMTVLINWLIAALHGCSLIFKDDGSDYCTEMYQARTKKIILISDTIATSSSVVQASITKNPKRLDLGGAAVLVYRLFSDARFVAKLKEEFLQSELDKIYDERAKGLL